MSCFKNKIKEIANLSVGVMLIGGLVFSIGFGLSLHIARQEAQEATDEKVLLSISHIQNYLEGQLQRIEDVAHTSLVDERITVTKSKGHIVVNQTNGLYAKAEPIFQFMDLLLQNNPHICGVGLGLEPEIPTTYEGEYGSALYATNIKGYTEHFQLGTINDFRSREWYHNPATLGYAKWCHTYTETSSGKLIVSYGIPLYGNHDNLIGIFDLDINPETFLKKCAETASFDGAEIILVDEDLNLIFHPDTTLLLHNISEFADINLGNDNQSVSDRSDNNLWKKFTINKNTKSEATIYYAPIPRIGWTAAIKCTNNIIFENVNRMKAQLYAIAIISILFMILCFLLIFRRLRIITISKTNIESELKIAADIQQNMLPKADSNLPDKESFDIHGLLKPAKEVGGDLYDYLIRDGKCFFCIGDVCGKGVPGALFMSIIHALFRQACGTSDDPGYIMTKINEEVASDNESNMFCTMFIGILDLKTGLLNWCNAGHNAPVAKTKIAGGTISINFDYQSFGFPIGSFPDTVYTTNQTQWQPGDTIILYTDGVTEAENKEHKPFSDEKLIATLQNAQQNGANSCKDFADIILSDVRQFAIGTEQSDDITLLVVEYKGQTQSNTALHLINDVAQTPILGEWITKIGQQNGWNESQIFKMNLAVEEAVVNCMEYAYESKQNQPVDVFLTATEDTLTFVIDDEGVAFDPTSEVPVPDISLPSEKRPIGGLGVMLAKQYAQAMSYERHDGHNRLTLKFYKNELI